MMRTTDPMPPMPPDAEARAIALANRVRPLFAGEHPGIVGAVLAQLVATHLACHRVPRATHATLLQLHRDSVQELLPIIEAELGLAPLEAT